MNKKIKLFLIIIFFSGAVTLSITKFYDKNEIQVTKENVDEETIYSSNIIENVRYESKDIKGNKYVIEAALGEIDYKNPSIIFLTGVKASIKPRNSSEIIIKSDYGKYFIDNNDTIFSKNVIITFLNNKILGEYLDFSILRSSMTLSKNVVYSDLNNIMKADAIEINLETKKAKIFMYENTEKINIKSF